MWTPRHAATLHAQHHKNTGMFVSCVLLYFLCESDFTVKCLPLVMLWMLNGRLNYMNLQA